MTIVFKSDKSINYEPLIQVGQGIGMDFRQGAYAVDGVSKKLTDVLSVTTNTKRGFYDLAGSYNEVAEKTAKLAFSPYNNKRGLHKEAATTINLLSEVATSLPERYVKTLDSTDVSHYVLSLQGGGAIIVEDAFGETHTVKQNQPALLLTDSSNPNMTLDMQREGSVDYVALNSNSRYLAPPVNRNTTSEVLSGDLIAVNNITSDPKTIIITYSASKASNAPMVETNLWLFKLKGTDFNLSVGFKATTGQALGIFQSDSYPRTYISAGNAVNGSGVFSVKIEEDTLTVYHSGESMGSLDTSLSPVTSLTLSEITDDRDSLASRELNAYIHELYMTPDVMSDEDLLGLSFK